MQLTLTLIYILGFVMGTAFGSFINMLTWRIKRGESLGGRSYSDSDGKPLDPIDQIPVLSYLIFKGKSRTSGEKLPILYPLIELLAGFTVLLVFIEKFNPLLPPLEFLGGLGVAIVFAVLMLFFASYDYQYWELPANVIEVGVFAVLVFNLGLLFVPLAGFDPVNNLITAFAAATVTILIVRIFPASLLKHEDAGLMFIAGAMLGSVGVFLALLLASLAGSFVGTAVAVKTGNFSKVKLPFAPLLAFGALISYLYGADILHFVFSRFV